MIVTLDKGGNVEIKPHKWRICSYILTDDLQTGKPITQQEEIAFYTQLPFNILLQDCKGKTFDCMVGNLVLIQENEATVCVDITDENLEKYLKQLQNNVLRCDYLDLEKCVI